MYLLYLDESGDPEGSGTRYFVLGGLAVFERVTYFLSERLDQVLRSQLGTESALPLHAAAIRAGRGPWRKVSRDKRAAVLLESGRVLRESNRPGVVLFAVAAEKTSARRGENLVRGCMEQVCLRFDGFLRRLYRKDRDPQRGLVIVSEGQFHKRARVWVEQFRQLGTRWGKLHNFCDIPYFAQARETRLLQAADFVAHAVWRFYEHGDNELLSTILERFDETGGKMHGLFHWADSWKVCGCPACASRGARGRQTQAGDSDAGGAG